MAWALLDCVANIRYPASEPRLWYLIPSIDVTAVLGFYALCGLLHWRVPRLLHVAFALLLGLVRCLRLGDGLGTRYLYRAFNLYIDLPLVPELVRLYYSTVPLWKFTLSIVGLVIGIVGLGALVYRALSYIARYLSTPRRVTVFGSIIGAFVAVSPFVPKLEHRERYYGAFAASALPRLGTEADFLLHVRDKRAERLAAVTKVQRELGRTRSNLAKLEHADVLIFIIESYGQTVLERAHFEKRIRPAYENFEAELAARGFFMASSLLDAPTYGGGSRLAHATLATAVRTSDGLAYEILATAKPRAMAGFFRDAGYRAVLVQPATTRKWPQTDFYQFDQTYYASAFDYRGPAFAWAPMPDQYVLDFVRRREIKDRSRPLFIEYALVSSHAPWNHQPPIIDDWAKIRDGAIYEDLEPVRYPITWSNLSNASEGYIRSISYDLEILKRYLKDFVRDGSLIIILGDHQPAAEVTGNSPSRAVPIHVLSRNQAFIAPFVARGYTAGMRPRMEGSRAGMETLLPHLLQDFSTPQGGGTRR